MYYKSKLTDIQGKIEKSKKKDKEIKNFVYKIKNLTKILTINSCNGIL